MLGRVVIRSKFFNGWLIRLILFKTSLFVNVFSPNGGFYSWNFGSIDKAILFYNFLLKSIKRKNKKYLDRAENFLSLTNNK
jgi:glucan phosphoethanolaminetransferase (alkaline phosphatase superfamily)